MVRGIDIQNVVANTQFVSRARQVAQTQANFAQSQYASEAQKHEDEKKEQVVPSHKTEQEHSAIDANRHEQKEHRNGGGAGSQEDEKQDSMEQKDKPRILSAPDDRGQVIDLEA